MSEKPKVAHVWDWTALLAYFVIGVATILLLKLGLNWLSDEAGISALKEGRSRRELGMIIAVLLGIPVTRLIARALDLGPARVKRQ